MKIGKLCVVMLLPTLALASSLNIGASVNGTTVTDFNKIDKKLFQAGVSTGSLNANFSVKVQEAGVTTTLFEQSQQLENQTSSDNKKCQNVVEQIELAKKTAKYSLTAKCEITKEELKRVSDIVIVGAIITEFKKRGLENKLTSELLEEARTQILKDKTAVNDLETAVDAYLKHKYSIDGKEVAISLDRDELSINIEREMKLSNVEKTGKLFKKKLSKFDLDHNELTEIYKKTLPIFASELVDGIEILNYTMSLETKKVSTELYNNIDVSKFSCKISNDDYKCSSDLKWSIGFKAQDNE
ncbi:MAG: hypothetical protein BM556_00340 [Bacteriovorax sp. MedPE-SWde]|nr:MAG: hypothetical protein BM556_00340 [Bacteriovorax sp. MedPE-SWde]